MNIAIVLLRYTPFGGYERQAAILAEALAKRGDNVTIFANEWVGDSGTGIKFQKVPMLKWVSWLKVLSFALLSRYYLFRGKEHFDVIVAFDRTLVMDIYRAGNACHKEWLNFRKTIGGLSASFSIAINPLHIIINKIEKHIFTQTAKIDRDIIVLAPIGAQQIQHYYPIDENRFVVIPPAVDINRFDRTRLLSYRAEQRKILCIGNDTLMLLHVGSGFRIKGLSSTIESLPILLKKGLKVDLVVVGADRRGTNKYRRLCHKLGLEKHVHFMRGVKEVEWIYAAADIFVLPSLFETFCIAAIEALSCGLPVIIGRGAGVSDIIEKEKVGKVIAVPADPNELADIIKETAITEKELQLSGRIEEVWEHRRAVALNCDRSVVIKRFLSVIDRMAEKKKLHCRG